MTKKDFGVWEVTVPPKENGGCGIMHDSKLKVLLEDCFTPPQRTKHAPIRYLWFYRQENELNASQLGSNALRKILVNLQCMMPASGTHSMRQNMFSSTLDLRSQRQP